MVLFALQWLYYLLIYWRILNMEQCGVDQILGVFYTGKKGLNDSRDCFNLWASLRHMGLPVWGLFTWLCYHICLIFCPLRIEIFFFCQRCPLFILILPALSDADFFFWQIVRLEQAPVLTPDPSVSCDRAASRWFCCKSHWRPIYQLATS